MRAWRPMAAQDLAAVAGIEAALHAPLPPEGEALFAERLELFPEGCLAVGEPVAGYAVAHPARLATPPVLGVRLGRLPADADCLWLHDVALLPAARGQGLVASLLAHLARLAASRGLDRLALVAVHGTAPMWAGYGFRPRIGAAHASYGDDAALMLLSPTTPAPPSPAQAR